MPTHLTQPPNAHTICRAVVAFLMAVRRFAGALNPSYTYGKRPEPASEEAPQVSDTRHVSLALQVAVQLKLVSIRMYRTSFKPDGPYDPMLLHFLRMPSPTFNSHIQRSVVISAVR